MTGEHQRIRHALGAYALGALDRDERAVVEAHLVRCPGCRGELEAFDGLPELIGRLTEDEARNGLPKPRPELAERAVAAAARDRRRARRAVRVWRLMAVAAAIVVVAVLVPLWPRDGGQRLLSDGTVGPVTGTASISPRPWGTAIELDVSGLPRRPAYVLVAVADGDRSEPAAWWGPTDNGSAELAGACSLRTAAIAHLEVTATDGEVLAVFRRG